MTTLKSSVVLNYYQFLGLNENSCNNNDIKKAYRKLALRWHPDKNLNNHDEAIQKFHEISKAFQVLSNANIRSLYDNYRCKSNNHFTTAAAATAESASSPPSFGALSADEIGEGISIDLNHLFSQFKPPQQVFEEFFGGRNPFCEIFSSDSGSDLLFCNNGKQESVVGDFDSMYKKDWFLCLDENEIKEKRTSADETKLIDLDKKQQTPDEKNFKDSDDWMKTTHVKNVKGNVRHVSTSTRLKNGRKIVRKKVIENGTETITMEENGELILMTVNGLPVDINGKELR